LNRNFSRTLLSAAVLLTIVFALGACRERTLISSKVSPANDTAGVASMSLGCITHTYFDDNINTSTNISGISSNQAIGNFTDSFFGTITAATYFQLAPENAPGAVFDAAATIDSIILIVPYSGFTDGDTTDVNATQTYQAFYVTDTLGYYSTYFPYSSKPVDVSVPLSAPVTVNVHQLKDSVTVVNPRNKSGLRIPLKISNFMSKLNPALTAAYQSSTASTTFVSKFGGICVRPADTRKTSTAIPYFRLDGSTDFDQAGVMIYYHESSADSVVDSMSFSYQPTGCAHFNNVTKSYRGYPISNLIHSTQANDSIIALQNQPGGSIDIKVYGINSIPANVVINKAELQLSVLPVFNPLKYQGPERIYPTGVGNGIYPAGIIAGLEYIVEDQKPITSLTPYNILDGRLHVLPNGVSTYTIGLPREVIASIAAKNDTLHFKLNGTQDFYGAFHLVAGGGNYSDSTYRAKLIVVYSTLKHN